MSGLEPLMSGQEWLRRQRARIAAEQSAPQHPVQDGHGSCWTTTPLQWNSFSAGPERLRKDAPTHSQARCSSSSSSMSSAKTGPEWLREAMDAPTRARQTEPVRLRARMDAPTQDISHEPARLFSEVNEDAPAHHGPGRLSPSRSDAPTQYGPERLYPTW